MRREYIFQNGIFIFNRTAETCGALDYCKQYLWNVQSPRTNNEPMCEVCLESVKAFYKQLKHNSNFLPELCEFFATKNLETKCLNWVENLPIGFIQMFISELNPEKICGKLKVCGAVKTDIELIESNYFDESDEENMPAKSSTRMVGSADCIICKSIAKKVK